MNTSVTSTLKTQTTPKSPKIHAKDLLAAFNEYASDSIALIPSYGETFQSLLMFFTI